jgi:sulfur-oxidizing protein SoxY
MTLLTPSSTRRQVIAASALMLFAVRPARALDAPLQQAIRAWAGSATPREGRVTLTVAELIDNGNLVPLNVRVTSPMTPADHVQEIMLLNERNPGRELARFQLSPVNGRAEVSTRVRLATSQHLVALARMSDGSVWQHTVEVVVTLAACIES